MMKRARKNHFTLVELLVALGIFSILMVLFMQTFAGMRLAWTNSERRTDSHAGVRVAMDMLSTLTGAAYYSSASTFSGNEGQFPFQADQTSTRPGKLYFACKTNFDLPGSNPIRFIGVQVPNAGENFGLTDTALYYKLYLTVLSNEAGVNNGTVYPRFSPEFLDASNNEISASAALTALKSNLDAKLAADTNHRIELLRNVTDFQVRAYDVNGNLFASTDVYCVPDMIELRVSVLGDEDFSKWTGMKGGVDSAENAAAQTFRLQKQTTFSRRIHIGDRWKNEVRYDRYP